MQFKAYAKKYAEYYDIFNREKNYQSECAFIKKCFSLYSSHKVNSILDVGCGTGEHSRVLSSWGYNVTGIDLSQDMVRIANNKGIRNASFYVSDMRKFDLKRRFDAAICMYNVLGYLNTDEDIESAFLSINKHLIKEGLFILECWNGNVLLKEGPSSRRKISNLKGKIIERTSYPSLDIVNKILKVNFKLKITYNNKIELFEENHFLRYLFPNELKMLLEKNNFSVIHKCLAFDLQKNENDGWNMVFISRRKD